MKRLKKSAACLKVLGWILLGIAAALTLYSLASDSDGWKGMKVLMKAGEQEVGAFERVSFDHQYFDAMRSAASTTGETEEERIADVREYFSSWETRLEEGMQKRESREVEEGYKARAEQFDADEYIAFFENLDNSEEQRHIRQAIEYIDSVVKPASGKKAIAKAQAVSAESSLESF